MEAYLPPPCTGPTLGDPPAPTAAVVALSAAVVAADFEVTAILMALPAAAPSAAVSPGVFFSGEGEMSFSCEMVQDSSRDFERCPAVSQYQQRGRRPSTTT